MRQEELPTSQIETHTYTPYTQTDVLYVTHPQDVRKWGLLPSLTLSRPELRPGLFTASPSLTCSLGIYCPITSLPKSSCLSQDDKQRVQSILLWLWDSDVFSSILLWMDLWPCYAIFSDLWLHKPPLWLLQRNAVWWYRMITRQQNLLVCFASYSTPARSSSEELFHHSTVLATKALTSHLTATSDNTTCGKHPPLTEQEEASVRRGVTGSPLVVDAERDEKQARQTLASTKHITTLSPSHFLPVPDGFSATTTRTDTGRRKGRAQSESEDPQGGTSWLDSNLPATWATSNNYTTFHECLPHWKRTT